jgi:hypothetical protein
MEDKLGAKFRSLDGSFDAEGFVSAHFPDSADGVNNAEDQTDVSLDPKSLLASFTETLGDLRKLQQEVDVNISALCGESHDKNKQYRAEIVTHKRSQQDIFRAMRQLDDRFKNVGTIAVQIGDQLSGLDKQRQRAVDTRTLLQYFEGFNHVGKDGTSGLDPVFTDPERLHEAADAMQQLERIITGLNMPGTEEAIHQIERTSEQVKARLLEHFADALRAHSKQDVAPDLAPDESKSSTAAGGSQDTSNHSGDLQEVRDFANALLKYDSSDNLHNCYVYNVLHAQFAAGPRDRTEFIELYARVESVCRREKHVIRAVFPPLSAATVYQLLVERIFIDPVFGIQAKVAACILAPRRSQGADWMVEAEYLDSLSSVYEHTALLADALLSQQKPQDEGRTNGTNVTNGSNNGTNNGNNNGSNGTNGISGLATDGDMAMVSRDFLDDQVSGLFASYRRV